MAPEYPRATFKRVIKTNSGRNLSKNSDVLVYLNYVLFMEKLIKEAAIEAKKSGDKGLTARSVKRALRDALQKFKG